MILDQDGKEIKVGDPIVASRDDGPICEGNVFCFLPDDYVVIRNHESKKLENWRPDYCSVLK